MLQFLSGDIAYIDCAVNGSSSSSSSSNSVRSRQRYTFAVHCLSFSSVRVLLHMKDWCKHRLRNVTWTKLSEYVWTCEDEVHPCFEAL